MIATQRPSRCSFTGALFSTPQVRQLQGCSSQIRYGLLYNTVLYYYVFYVLLNSSQPVAGARRRHAACVGHRQLSLLTVVNY